MHYHSYQNDSGPQDTTVSIPAEKHPDKDNNSNCHDQQQHQKRASGFKSAVIYVLLFVNLVLLTRFCSYYYGRQEDHSNFRINNAYSSLGAYSNNDNNSNNKPHHEPEHDHLGGDYETLDFWLKMALIVFLVMVGGIFAGECSSRPDLNLFFLFSFFFLTQRFCLFTTQLSAVFCDGIDGRYANGVWRPLLGVGYQNRTEELEEL
jgi:hypothetical protein